MRAAVAAVALLVLAGCGQIRTAGPGFVVGESFGFIIEEDHTAIRAGADPDVALDQLTVNGPLLDRIFFGRIPDGGGIVTPAFEDWPRWWSGTPVDGLDGFLAESLETLGYAAVETTGKQAHLFAGAPGLLYRLDLTDAGGLEMRGLALASVQNGALNLIVFVAPREHYFESRRPATERMFDSLTGFRR